MKKLLLLTVIVLSLIHCETKKSPEANLELENQIVIGQIDTIYSDILKEHSKIWVHIPESASDECKYPVLYLLDGDGHFYSVTGMIKQLSTTNGNTVLPEMIVIGITNNDRTRDLTPTHVNEIRGDSSFAKTSGGGKKFLNFIEKELIPFVENNYPATNYRTFVGHSLGGLTVIDALVDRPELFNNYVAIDPSLSWDEQIIVKRADSALNVNKFDGKALYVGIANTMNERMDITEVRKDTAQSTEHIRSILKFVSSTETKNDNGLLFGWKYYNNDDHGSVPLITEYDALRFLFPWHKLNGLDKFFSPNSTATTKDLINLLTSHYENVSNHFGYKVLPPEQFINSLGYWLMSEMPDKAYALLNLNIQNYPNSVNVFDSMGDYYLSQSDTLNAIEHFTKALEIGDSPISKEKLEKLKIAE